MTRRTAHTVPDVAERLMREFEGFLPISTITEVVTNLGKEADLPAAALAAQARSEIVGLIGGDPAACVAR